MWRAAVVLGCAAALAASAMGPKKPEVVPVPLLERGESFEAEAPVEGILVTGVPYGATGWQLHIVNDSDQPISIVWDESSFVTAQGVSAGRIITGSTRRIDSAKSQPPAPLAPRASVHEVVFAEKLYARDIEEREIAEAAAQHGGISPETARVTQRARADAASSIIGGKLYLTIQTAAGKQAWRGVVRGERVAAVALPMAAPSNPRNDPAKASAFWCSNLECFADEARCPQCAKHTDVWCASGEPGFKCAVTRAQCLTLREAERDRTYGECVPQHARTAR
ncbi:MAG: hypothetical protein SFX73_18640 [Kofleriaceae bacterium]|nr:hypothetical protein [Kofleriaceae bacterium]